MHVMYVNMHVCMRIDRHVYICIYIYICMALALRKDDVLKVLVLRRYAASTSFAD